MPNTPSIEEESHQVQGIPNVPSEIREDDEETIALTIKSWDQIGALKSEIVSSILAKQASILCERFAKHEDNDRPRKRAKTNSAAGKSNNGKEPIVSAIVTSDEGSALESASHSQKSEESSLEDELEADRQIDRLGRMSRLMIQLEYFHQELRHEIASIAQEVDIDNDNILAGALPSEVGNLRALTSFSFQDNNLSGSLPTTLINVTDLNLLIGYNNRFSGDVPQLRTSGQIGNCNFQGNSFDDKTFGTQAGCTM